ncbi:uncharacterized protein LOC143289988 isoform X2 [Babylonia areolata]|uniref:uncharacterized protein LOC143289988 isoform X2 n=1 Tax=Babylonia areolata TaxID=304850 RepID=UPI003FD409C1
MAMNYHDEARIKQERLNRWKQEKERSDAGPSNQYVGDQLDQLASKEKTDRVLTTDPGQFRQIRSQSTHPRKEVLYDTGVIFNRVVHDPNYNYRMEKAMGGNVLHVNPIYKIMYPASFTYRRAYSSLSSMNG